MQVWLGACSVLPELLSGRLTCAELPDLAAKHGFEGIDWLDRLLPSWQPEAWADLGRACDEAGLGPCGLNLSLTYTAAPGRLERQIGHLERLLGQCHLLGVKVVRLALDSGGLSVNNLLQLLADMRPTPARQGRPLGPLALAAYRGLNRLGLTSDRGRRPSAPPRASWAQLQAAANPLRRLTKIAGGLGLTLGLENHWGLTSHAQDILALLDLVANERLGVCLDLNNFYEDQDALAQVAGLAPSAVQVHYKARLADPEAEAAMLNYAAMLGLLKEEGYQGAFSLECEGPRPGLEHAAAAAQVLRRLWQAA
ncbi:MAG: sugar phosphate isomerase/epimerase [Desulfarculus sp.]|jgi:sugar phosphate isomerase/epimerase|nr:MAG: sugar phosphate isomerase/epimerase [Desulfarculus sp.]